MREALFSVLGDTGGARVLDLYAGSGALGIEALSRGAAHATFVEHHRAAQQSIRHNLGQLGLLDESELIATRVEQARRRLEELAPFDLVLCDPPWAQLERTVRMLPALLRHLTTPNATLVLEHPARIQPEQELGQLFDQRTYGDTGLSLFNLSSSGRMD